MAGLSRSDEERMAASYARNHHVSREHLDRYLAEFDFRHSTCETTRHGARQHARGPRRWAEVDLPPTRTDVSASRRRSR